VSATRPGSETATDFKSKEKSKMTIGASLTRVVKRFALGGLGALLAAACLAAPAQAAFGIVPSGQPEGFEASVDNLQAGAPVNGTTNFNMNLSGIELDGGQIRDLRVDLPPGVAGNPQGIPFCTQSQLQLLVPTCPASSQVGVIQVRQDIFGFIVPILEQTPVFNMVPPPTQVAQFGFVVGGVPTNVSVTVRPGDYGVRTFIKDTPQLFPVSGATVSIWGIPADPSHDKLRVPCLEAGGGTPTGASCPSSAPRVAFLQNGTSCDSAPKTTTITATSWLNPSVFSPLQSATSPPLTGCDKLPFQPRIKVTPSTAEAGVPTGLSVDLETPQNADLAGLATAHLKDSVVKLPEGMAVSPAAADGLGACSDAQLALLSNEPPSCPDSSKIGSLVIETPALADPVHGWIYLGTQTPSQLLRFFLVMEGHGLVVKIPGRVDLDPVTGQLTSTFDDNPQLPFSKLHLEFKGGPRAALVNPPTCGKKDTTATLTSWARPNEPVVLTDSFQLTSGPNGTACPASLAARPFSPRLSAGVVNPSAGSQSPFVLRLTREDETQQFSALDVTMPPGLAGVLKGIPYCPETSIAAADGRLGSSELATPSCPSASQIGTVVAGAGAGTHPFFVSTGKAYLAGPYKGAPLSLVTTFPPVAGPLDLNTVVVRSAIFVDPTDAHLTVKSDPLPQILQGIPIDLRDLRVNIDRPDFIEAPTNCTPMSVGAQVLGSNGALANPSQRFQVGNCASLGFEPKLSLGLKGGTKRGDYPALTAVVKARPGDANIGKAAVTLPHSEFLAQNHIRTVCTRVQYAAEACPAGSIYGYAKATTPLLGKPLEGPVYLRSSSHQLPDLVAALHGQIDIDLAGRIDSVHGGIRNTFELVPDAPVTKFELKMKGGKKGLLVNSRDICRSANLVDAKFSGQNGKMVELHPKMGSSCGGGVPGQPRNRH
jgi:hypothetical protein